MRKLFDINKTEKSEKYEKQEKHEKREKRDMGKANMLAKKIGLYFLVFFIFITAISKIMYNALIAEVDVEKLKDGEIYMEILGEAVVESDGEIPCYVTSGLYVNSINVDVGDEVKKGDVLFEIDTKDLEKIIEDRSLKLDKMEMTLQDAISADAVADRKDDITKKQLNDDYNSTKEKFEKKKKDAQADIAAAKKAYEDYLFLATSTDASQEQKYLDDIAAKQEIYDNLVDEEKEALRAIKNQIDLGNIGDAENSNIEQQKMDIEVAKNEINELKAILVRNGQFISEYDGKISKINLSVGEATMSSAAIVLAKTTGEYLVTAEFPIDYKKYIAVEDELVLDTENEKQKMSVESVFEDKEKNVIKVCSSIEANEELEIGNYYKAQIKTQSKHYEFVVPKSAVVTESAGNYYIYVADMQSSILGENLAATKYNVKILDKDNDRVAIEGPGLFFSMDVIVDSQRQLSNGNRVKIRDK